MLWPLMTPKDRLEELRSMGGNEAKLASQIEKDWRDFREPSDGHA